MQLTYYIHLLYFCSYSELLLFVHLRISIGEAWAQTANLFNDSQSIQIDSTFRPWCYTVEIPVEGAVLLSIFIPSTVGV